MKRFTLVLVLCLANQGCISPAPSEQQMAVNANQCETVYGLAPGSQDYAACRLILDRDTAASNQARLDRIAVGLQNAGAASQPAPMSPPSQQRCYTQPWNGGLVTRCW
jgi:hypothetical protein